MEEIILALLLVASGGIFLSLLFLGRMNREKDGDVEEFALQMTARRNAEKKFAFCKREELSGTVRKNIMETKLEEIENSDRLLMLDPSIRKLSVMRELEDAGLITSLDYSERKKKILDEV